MRGMCGWKVQVLERWGGLCGLSTIYYMLPLGSIASGAHHSILECAVVLSELGIMDYHIGFPHTLIPNDLAKGDDALKSRLAEALTTANNTIERNQLRILGFSGSDHKLKGGIVFDAKDKWALRTSGFTDAVTLHSKAGLLKPYPTLPDVLLYCTKCDPLAAKKLPTP